MVSIPTKINCATSSSTARKRLHRARCTPRLAVKMAIISLLFIMDLGLIICLPQAICPSFAPRPSSRISLCKVHQLQLRPKGLRRVPLKPFRLPAPVRSPSVFEARLIMCPKILSLSPLSLMRHPPAHPPAALSRPRTPLVTAPRLSWPTPPRL